MKVGLHRYSTDPSLPQKDGVNLAHENITALLESPLAGDLQVEFHDLEDLVRMGPDAAKEVLQSLDCVVANVGPHAHYYFWLRAVCGLDFRIIRDVRTAIWSSYLLQEHLLEPLLRPTDTLLVASHYTHSIYVKLFPHLADSVVVKCYPLTVGFPLNSSFCRNDPRSADWVTVGYIGRLSDDKNILRVIDLLISLNRRSNRRYRLIACGAVHSPSCSPARIRDHIARELGDGDYFRYEPARSNDQIWPLLASFDLMVFPSTSNLETLGRVIIEASYAGVPIIAADHAAAAELIPKENLCPVSYRKNVRFSAHFDHSLGQVSLVDIEQRLLAGDVAAASNCHTEYHRHINTFLELLTLSDRHALLTRASQIALSESQQRFVDGLVCEMPPPLSMAEAIASIELIVKWFLELQDRNASARRQVADRLLDISRHPQRTRQFIDKHFNSRGDLTNVGGMDIELCHAISFYPEFTLT